MTKVSGGCKLLCAAVVGIQLVGCSSSSQLVGTWKEETPASSSQITGFATAPTDERIFKADNTETIIGSVPGGMSGTVNYNVDGDSLTEVAPNGGTSAQTFELDGDKLTITMTIDNEPYSETYDRIN